MRWQATGEKTHAARSFCEQKQRVGLVINKKRIRIRSFEASFVLCSYNCCLLFVLCTCAFVLALHLYEGIIQIIPIDTRGNLNKESFDLRMERLQVRRIAFLDGCVTTPHLAVLFDDAKQQRHVRIRSRLSAPSNTSSSSRLTSEAILGSTVTAATVSAWSRIRNSKITAPKPQNITSRNARLSGLTCLFCDLVCAIV